MEQKGLLYPIMVIAGIAVTVASLLGIAAITGYLPEAHSQSQAAAFGKPAAQPAEMAYAQPAQGIAPAISGSVQDPHARVAVAESCHVCGHIRDIYARRIQGQTSGVGLVAGSVIGGVLGNQVGGGNGRTAMTVLGAVGGAYAGNQVEKARDTHVIYVIKVDMDEGGIRTFIRHYPPRFSIGEPVRIRGNQIFRRA
ncbi:MAG: glycine zipper 2TM domain-containing protein [Pseudomonadota bacterium]|nr:glycine zipper 2TM domain-containing protein [Pseudomonadota bacterium]